MAELDKHRFWFQRQSSGFASWGAGLQLKVHWRSSWVWLYVLRSPLRTWPLGQEKSRESPNCGFDWVRSVDTAGWTLMASRTTTRVSDVWRGVMLREWLCLLR
ncbi:hypothetical protein EGW08_019025 [Elysia chlorotica]|uniref:Uncharacterized protein n=1 Tax=Elysia chlorotica TaxID=188477 RepID=A0A3S0ZQX6_ELYCH|nr:hypothetical protein EGW08_019025 [Elysia chlorotica]